MQILMLELKLKWWCSVIFRMGLLASAFLSTVLSFSTLAEICCEIKSRGSFLRAINNNSQMTHTIWRTQWNRLQSKTMRVPCVMCYLLTTRTRMKVTTEHGISRSHMRDADYVLLPLLYQIEQWRLDLDRDCLSAKYYATIYGNSVVATGG